MEVNDAPGLLSMPLEVITHMGHFLSPRLLYDISALCLDLRTAFNSNTIWRRHSQGGLYGQMLEHTTSLVEPVFTVPALDTLDPLCDQRLHYIRQSRLLHNLRHGQYVHHVINRPSRLTKFYNLKPFSPFLGYGQITYKSDYMFVAGYVDSAESREYASIYVYDIRQEPRLVTTFRVGDEQSHHHDTTDEDSIRINVVGDKLAILYVDGFRVHEIDLPSATFPLLHSFSWSENIDYCLGRRLTFDKFVIQLEEREIVNIWNIDTAEQFFIKSPEGWSQIAIENVSVDEGLILLYFQKDDDDDVYDFHVYDLNKQQYTFNVRIDVSNLHWGAVGNDHIALIVDEDSDKYVVFHYDIETPNMIVKKSGLINLKQDGVGFIILDPPHIIRDCLVISDDDGVKVFSLSGLDLLYTLPRGGENILRGFCDLITISLFNSTDIWDFNERRKLFELEGSTFDTASENFSKMLGLDKNYNLHVYSFW